MFTKLETEKVFRDPLYGYIRVEYKIISELIDSREVQRLRRIRQLSGVSMVFHLAEHSRFTHSLGTYELARRVSERVTDVKNLFSLREVIILLCSALLHDLGHGPYSHCFEHVFGVNHEKMTTMIILGDTEVHHILDKYDHELASDVAGIIAHEGKYPLIESLISSQLDCDRMDYLKRDSYFTGAFYGDIDVEKLLRSMRIIDGKIVYKTSAINTIEDYLVGRYHMYWSVYYHPTARSYEIMLEKIYLRIQELIEQDFVFPIDISILKRIKNMDVSDYLMLDDTYINGVIQRLQYSNDEILSDLCTSFMNRHIFSYVDYEHDGEKVNQIKEYFEKHNDEKKYYYKVDEVKQIIYQYALYQPMSSEINMLKPNGEIVPVSSYSLIVKGLTLDSKKSDVKVFYKGELYV